MVLDITAVRLAEPDDLPLIAAIEADADATFAEVMDTSAWPAPPSGAQRAARGTVLVIGQPAVGFAHVVDADGGHHLDALAVRRDRQRRGFGGRLLRAAYGVVLDAGGDALTLTTFADVPWNGPWYARAGFTEIDGPLPPELAAIRAQEQTAGLDGAGRRVVMRRSIVDTPAPRPAVSVIPIRDGEAGLEVFVQHRVGTMDFVPNAVVFPGGRVDPEDEAAGARLDLDTRLLAEHERAWAATDLARFGGPESGVRTTLATGLREVEEETGGRLDPAALIPWDNWVTPIGGPKRFDVRFLLLPVIDAALAATFDHATTEAHRSEWTPVTDVVAGAQDGSLVLVSPTRVLLEELAGFARVADAAGLRPHIMPTHHDTCPSPARRGHI